MDEYAGSAITVMPAELRPLRWAATTYALPLRASVRGVVIGRQPFGAFVRVDSVPDAMALIEITTLLQGMELPALGARIVGEVIGHAEHNHQVRLRIHDGEGRAE